jgi:hypothetical protein
MSLVHDEMPVILLLSVLLLGGLDMCLLVTKDV